MSWWRRAVNCVPPPAHSTSVHGRWRPTRAGAGGSTLQPRLGLKADIASGDGNLHDRRLGTFNALFPKSAYFSEASLLAPANLMDLQPTLSLRLHDAVTTELGVQMAWKHRRADAVYTTPAPLVALPGSAGGARRIGTQYKSETRWQASEHWQWQLQLAWVDAGPALKQAGGQDTLFASIVEHGNGERSRVATPVQDAGAWSPLKIQMFRSIWLAILASNIGTWVNDVAAAWVMAERTGSPLMVALVQSATTVPIVLLALAAGTLADIVDRRKYLLATQGWMLLVAAAMAALTAMDLLTPQLLVLLTFCMGCGAAMAMPAQAAIVSELVPQPMLASAVALNSIGINIARSIGPAIGGVIVAQLGAVWAFGFNAITFAAMLFVVWAGSATQSSRACRRKASVQD